MKRSLLCSLLAVVCSITPSFADDSVRAVQTRLKTDGFYFGDVSGNYDSETAAAVSRYQIRHGLPISGQLDPETSKALGVATAASSTSPAARADSASWQQLRKSDSRFLSKLNSGKIPPPGSASPASRTKTETPRTTTTAAVAETRRAPAPVVEPAPADPATFVLSRERLRDYVGAFVLAGLDPRVGSELEFFANQVRYYDQGSVSRDKIRRDLISYNQRWPQRRFWLAGEVDVEPQADSRLRVTFPLRYELRSASERSSGKVRKTLLVEVSGEDLQIVAVDESKRR
ncbi:MAG: peptidoglycan-binding protein [Verrucomicrobiota bacterium]|nr:peptidoglycan-binding protein [Verrucomicrobiota bacterium]